MQPLGAREVEHRLVDRDRLDGGGDIVHQRPDLAGDRGVFVHVGADHRRVRAGPQRLEHRHRRADAELARIVAGRHDDPPPAAADQHRPVGEGGIVPLLDRGVEGIAIDMPDRQPGEFRVPRDPGRPAGRAGRSPAGRGEAVAAERFHAKKLVGAGGRVNRAGCGRRTGPRIGFGG